MVKTKTEAEADINALMVSSVSDGGHKFWICGICEFSNKHKHLVFRHVDRLHYEFDVNCDICGKFFITIDASLEHKRNIHIIHK